MRVKSIAPGRKRHIVVFAWLGAGLLGTDLLGSCGGQAGEAAVALGLHVTATGISRGITGYCWGACSRGYVCNRESGLCEAGECNPACARGEQCVRLSVGLVCVANSAPGSPAQRAGLGGAPS